MVWVRIDDSFAQHPKVVAAGPLAMAMQVAALCYCNRNLTDGIVARAVVPTLLNFEGLAYTSGVSDIGIGVGDDASWQYVVGALVDTGMWEERPGGYYIHDYPDYQPTKAEVEEEREAARERMSRVRAKQTRTSSEQPPKCAVGSPYPVPVPVPLEDVSINDPGLPTAMRSSKESVSRRPPDGGASRTALTKTFFGATKTNEQVGALIDIGTSLGVELKGGPVAAIVREYGHGRPVLNALFEAAKYDAESPEQYMQGVLRNGRLQEGGGRSRRGARGSAASRGPDLEAWKRYAAGED